MSNEIATHDSQSMHDESPASLSPVSDLRSSQVYVASDDLTWASLLTRNLATRGVDAQHYPLQELETRAKSSGAGSWIVVDGGWPDSGLSEATGQLDSVLCCTGIGTVMVVDRLVGPHTFESFNPDKTVERAPDMRVLVRSLLSVFESGHSPRR